jgi:hypothetical protein
VHASFFEVGRLDRRAVERGDAELAKQPFYGLTGAPFTATAAAEEIEDRRGQR